MERWADKVAVITGASSGIGLATAKALVEHGVVVVGLARRRSKMESEMKDFVGKGQFYALECDVANEKSVRDAFDWIKKNLKTVHILVNNAGLTVLGSIIDLDFDELKKTLDVNFTGVLLCSKLAASIMKKDDHDSHIIMINSVLGHRVRRTQNTLSSNIYAPTKFAVKALAQVLENEVHGTRIRVTNISPGAVKTELLDNVLSKQPTSTVLEMLADKDIADAILYVLGTPQTVLVEELIIKPTGANY